MGGWGSKMLIIIITSPPVIGSRTKQKKIIQPSNVQWTSQTYYHKWKCWQLWTAPYTWKATVIGSQIIAKKSFNAQSVNSRPGWTVIINTGKGTKHRIDRLSLPCRRKKIIKVWLLLFSLSDMILAHRRARHPWNIVSVALTVDIKINSCLAEWAVKYFLRRVDPKKYLRI